MDPAAELSWRARGPAGLPTGLSVAFEPRQRHRPRVLEVWQWMEKAIGLMPDALGHAALGLG